MTASSPRDTCDGLWWSASNSRLVPTPLTPANTEPGQLTETDQFTEPDQATPDEEKNMSTSSGDSEVVVPDHVATPDVVAAAAAAETADSASGETTVTGPGGADLAGTDSIGTGSGSTDSISTDSANSGIEDRWAAFSAGLHAMRWTKDHTATQPDETPAITNTTPATTPKTHSVDPFAQQPHNTHRAVRSRWQQWSELGTRWSDEAWHDLGEAAQSVSTWTHQKWAQVPELLPGRTARRSALDQAIITQTTYEWCGADVTESPIGSLTGEHHTITLTDGSEVHAEIDEPEGWDPTQPTVVFSHGYALSRDSWHFQRQALRGQYRMVFWDQRGHGQSQNVDLTNMSIDLLGQDLWAVVKQTCPTGPIILVGHSMGGMTVMAAAAARPDILEERVVGVALVATSPSHLRHNTFGWGLAGAVVQRATPAALQALATIPRVTRRTRNAISAAEEFMVKRYSFASEVPTEVADAVVRMIRETTVPVLAAFMDKFDDHDKRAALVLFNRIETLVLVGDQDVMTPQSYSDRIVRRIPHAEYVVVQQAGHMVAMEHPELVTDHLRDFLRRATQG